MHDIEQAIEAMRAAGQNYAHARGEELALNDEHPGVKRRAIAELVGTTNPVTDRPHSATSASEQVDGVPFYAEHQTARRTAVIKTILAEVEYRAAQYRCRALTMGEAVNA